MSKLQLKTKILKKMSLMFLFIVFVLMIISLGRKSIQTLSQVENKSLSWWEVQSIDTMKYSRDLAREKLNDETFNQVIEEQIKKISQTGATHVAIATPYDYEFLPFLWRWVSTARKYNLNVWFRGNWAGWEKWFDYSKIAREEHLQKTEQFILQNKGLFKDNDIFTPCPECENGGPGDPRRTKDINGHRNFLIQEYEITNKAFKKIGKKVRSNFNSMNGDVVKLIMDKKTTEAMDGIIVIDHYVNSVETLVKDIKDLIKQSNGKVVLGEFGAPITDIHDNMSEQDQAEWINKALNELSEIPEFIGLNYWVNLGSSTQLWNKDGSPRQAVSVIYSFYTPSVFSGVVKDQLGKPIAQANIYTSRKNTVTNKQGEFQLSYQSLPLHLTVSRNGFLKQEFNFSEASSVFEVNLIKKREGFFFKIRKFINQLLLL